MIELGLGLRRAGYHPRVEVHWQHEVDQLDLGLESVAYLTIS